MDENVTQTNLERFKLLYEKYKDKIDEVLELASLYRKYLLQKEEEEDAK